MSRITVFWDWNGTVCDDLQAALDAVNEMLAARNKPPIDVETYRACIGTPISKFYAHFFDFSVDPMEKLAQEYRLLYRKYLPADCIAAGVRELLEEFRERGIRQVLLSSSHKESILPDLQKTGLAPFFEAVLAAEDWLAASKKERARRYMEDNGIAGRDAWFVGDLLHDRDTADYCGGTCLLLPFGHQSAEVLASAGDGFCRSFSEVRARILG